MRTEQPIFGGWMIRLRGKWWLYLYWSSRWLGFGGWNFGKGYGWAVNLGWLNVELAPWELEETR